MQAQSKFDIPKADDFRRAFREEFAREHGKEEIAWESPAPLEGGMVSDLPAFPLEALPSRVFRPFTEAVTRVNQVDPGMAGAMCLATLSLCARGQIDVELQSHKETLNLFLAAAALSGERKSETIKQFSTPVFNYAAKVKEETAPARREALNRKAILEKRLDRFRKKASTSNDYMDQVKAENDAMAIANELAELQVPADPCYITADVTEEKLAVLLSGNGEAIAVMSSEGGIFDIMAGRYSDTASIDLYLKGHCGDAHQVHRIAREDIILNRPVITVGLMIQPDVLRSIGSIQAFRGRGLLARFLYVWCVPKAGTRCLSLEGIPECVRLDYHQAIHELLGAKFDETVTLRLSDAARRTWEKFYAASESCLLPGEALHNLKDWGSKLPGAVARIAGLFHFAMHNADAPSKLISVENMEAAVTLGGFFADHARAVFAIMDEDAQLAGARRILEALRRHKVRQFKVRDIFNITGYRKVSEILPGVGSLMERGWVREISMGYSGKGRPGGQIYEVHPSVWK